MMTAVNVKYYVNRFSAVRYLALFILLTLLPLAGCSVFRRNSYQAPPETINRTADMNSKALQRALMLQKLTASQGATSYRIGPNDVLEIRVFEHEKMNVTTRVSGEGMISFPPLGDLQAGGRTERELEAIISDGLRGTYLADPHVAVLVKEVQARQFGIIGAVNLPGQYSSLAPMTLADLIAKAGGLKPEVGQIAYIVRYTQKQDSFQQPVSELDPTSNTIQVDLEGLLIRGERDWNVALEPSDVVNIPTAGMVFITGHGIRKPGTYNLSGKMSLQQLVDLAEGLKFEANHRLLLVREDEHGSKQVYHVDYDALRASRTADIRLRANDKVIVDRTIAKTAVAALGRSLAQVFRVMVSANYDVTGDNSNNNSNSGSSD